ncbi:transcriptional regulator, TetR family [Filimonas lacunae]|uniref:Transcriptional regulator, TetR family n=1 Tax=Filimonas lacunae TaxID=477680 RepID=A0A173M9C2_9BACT|nr:TetR/AcrR family transcriptional regulator [Filimonas lacunae]BAV04119.1 transcription regulator of multidrug efflux pump operon, TetR (AcrR) family [Filimonas lacunae]SIT15267.1 transcriptional regulator, TetR family [Filimonas lacunae]
MRPRNTDKQELVQQKAIEMLVTDGFEGFSVNKLAKACEISVATLYIYYKDKDDLVIKIATEEAKKMGDAMLRDFSPDLSLEDGLRIQWRNRYEWLLEQPHTYRMFEQLRNSTYQERIVGSLTTPFKESMSSFLKNAIDRGELPKMPLEVFWSVAYAPLYNLVRFHHDGKSMGNKPFKVNSKMIWQTFDLVMKALKP